MDQNDDPFETSSSRGEKVEALDLLEEGWFFGNLLHRKTRMSRCYSDPCPSSNFGQEMSLRNLGGESTLSSATKLREVDAFVRPDLVRTPSLPPCLGREEETRENQSNHSRSKLNQQKQPQNLLQTPAKSTDCMGRKEDIQEKGNDSRGTKMAGQSTRLTLLRTPSLPPCMGREQITQDNESDLRMSKSTGQASPNLPLHKGMAQSYSLPKYRPPRNLEAETINTNCTKEITRRLLNQTKLRKTRSDLEFEEVQGFRDLGFTFDRELSPKVVDILPGLQGKKPEDLEQDNVRRPYLSEAWLLQSCAPPIPNWAPKGSTEDMKAQIKFWARAVASNANLGTDDQFIRDKTEILSQVKTQEKQKLQEFESSK